jgi:hypothetical protein
MPGGSAAPDSATMRVIAEVPDRAIPSTNKTVVISPYPWPITQLQTGALDRTRLGGLIVREGKGAPDIEGPTDCRLAVGRGPPES